VKAQHAEDRAETPVHENLVPLPVRKGIRFSKRRDMHRIVAALVINFWFFCRIIA